VDDQKLAAILKAVERTFYLTPDFWINCILGLLGVAFSVLAFREARQAKVAAKLAGRTVKIQTVALELTETSMKLDRLEPDLKYRTARDLLSETSRRITRSIAPFTNEEPLKISISALREAIEGASAALNLVRPSTATSEDEAPQAVYNGIETHFAKINNCVADLIGLLEKQSSHFGE